MSTKRYLKPGIAAAIILVAGVIGYWKVYEEPRSELLAAIDAEQRANASLERSIRNRMAVRQELREAARSTIGNSADEVDARFRSALHRIAESCRLRNVQINTRAPEPVRSPIGNRRISGMPSMTGQIDFHAVRGEMTGTGSLEQVMRTVALLQMQPWVHRVESFVISPEGSEGREQDRFSLRVSAWTLMMADIAPSNLDEPVIATLPEEAADAWASIVGKNPFREPPQVAERPRRSQPAPPPARPPYDEWRLAGVIESHLGATALLVNTRSDEGVSIGTGASVGGAKLVSADGERAIFEIEGEEYEIFNGQTLEQRRPATR
jgi:hypothetical protein